MKTLSFLAALLAVSFQPSFFPTASASPNDVVSSGNAYIRVTVAGELVRFELANRDPKLSAYRIGGRDFTRSELSDLQTRLNWEFGFSAVGSLLGIAAGGTAIIAGGSAIAGAGLFAAGTDWAAVGLGVTLTGGSATAGVLAATSRYNPVSLYQKRRAVRDDVIEDKTVRVDGGDAEIIAFAKSLANALSHI